ncbi:MAG: hypothetical protein LBV36_06095 [Chromatiales bacterium]|jgi:hypothetical protein|nr:hypothetical protein [Chromatiales bacterium]
MVRRLIRRAAWSLALSLSAASLHAAPADTVYPELLGGVCADLHRITAAATPSLAGKELLLQEAERLTLAPETRALLTERLRNNAFTIAENQLWAPFESFDIALQSRSVEAGALKMKFSTQRYGEYGKLLHGLAPKAQDTIRRAALTILAESGQLPEILAFDNDRVRFMYREACLVNDAPGLMTAFIQGRWRDLDLGTDILGLTHSMRPEQATLSDPQLAFSSSGVEVVRLRRTQIERAFADPAAGDLLRAIHSEILNLVASPAQMEAHLRALVALFQHAYGIDPVQLEFDIEPATSGGSGYYFDSQRSYVFHYQRFIQKLDRLVAREKLDLRLAADRALAADEMFGELIDNAAHELAHAAQYQSIERLIHAPSDIDQALRARIADYQKNSRYKNTAWESHTLIGLLGDADYDRYRHQPLEEDAWAIGGEARALAFKLVTPRATPEQTAATLVQAISPTIRSK